MFNFLKTIAFLAFMALPGVAFGQNVRFVPQPEPHLEFTQEKGAAYAIFKRLDDVWIVSDVAKKPLRLEGRFPKILLEHETLYVPNGQGIRLGFEGLKNLHVVQTDTGFQVYLNKNTTIVPMDINLRVDHNGTTTLKTPLGSSEMLRAISLTTGESYLVLPTYLNRGVVDVRSVGAARQLSTNVGGIFVSSEGLPMGIDQKNSAVAFKPMQDVLSRAIMLAQQHIPPSLVEELMAQLNKTQQQIPTSRPRVKTSFDLALPKISGTSQASYGQALERMQAALRRVKGLRTDGRYAKAAESVPQVTLAPVDIASHAPSELQTEVLPSSLIFLDFGQRSLAEYAQTQDQLIQDWAFAQRQQQRVDAGHRLAAYYIFRGFYPEALGVLQMLRAELDQKKTAQGVDKALVLEGAAAALMGRFADAQEVLQKAEPSADQKIWMAVAKQGSIEKDDKVQGLTLFDENNELAAGYPPGLNQAVRYYYAKALFEESRLTDALNQLDRLAILAHNSIYLLKAQLLMGQIHEAQGQLQNAEQIYINLAGNSNRQISSFALLHFMNLLLKQGDLKPLAAIVRYENLRFLWRGDVVEEESLFQLADLYIKTANYRPALERLRSLTTHFPESKYAQEAAKKMTKIYEDVMMERLADPHLDGLGLLALYYDFRALTPSGDTGDELVTRVAEKLAALGLYKRAVAILDRQIKFRTRDRQAMGALGHKLAQIYAQSFAPEDGMRTLKATASHGLVQTLKNKRQLVKAQLLALDNDPKGALAAAKQVPTPEGEIAQAAFAWELEDYRSIVQALDGHFKGAGGADWTDEQAVQFLEFASAYSELGQRKALESLRSRYQPGISAHSLDDEVLFLLQAADAHSPLPDDVGSLEGAAGFWPKATKVFAEHNGFNNTYKALRKKWADEKRAAINSERQARQEELRNVR